MNILIIEDDIILAEKIGGFFKLSGRFNIVKTVNSYNDFLKEYHLINIYDIILLDIMLSKDYNDKNNGVLIIELIRKKAPNLPIIIISGLSDIKRLEKTFGIGVNDYLTKPIRLRELEIRTNYWVKNYFNSNLNLKKELKYKGLVKNLLSNKFYFNGEKIKLTKNSKFILSLFITKPEQILTDRYLIEKIWGDRSCIIERNPRVNILRLKQSLQLFGIDSWIINIRGEGYMLKK